MENLEFTSEFNEDLFDPVFSDELYFENNDEFDNFSNEIEIEDADIYASEMNFKDFVNLLH